jgi:hypothetical protein
VPLLCFFNGISFLKRLPAAEEITDQNKAIDLEKGFKMKDSFMQLKAENKTGFKCQSDLQSMYEDNIEGRQLDGLVPFQEKYLGNSYIDVY